MTPLVVVGASHIALCDLSSDDFHNTVRDQAGDVIRLRLGVSVVELQNHGI
jgi:hypothetical protein